LYALAGSGAIVLMSNDFYSLDIDTARTCIPAGYSGSGKWQTGSPGILVKQKENGSGGMIAACLLSMHTFKVKTAAGALGNADLLPTITGTREADSAGAIIEERVDDTACKQLIPRLRDCFAGRFGHPVFPRHLYLPVPRARNDVMHESISAV